MRVRRLNFRDLVDVLQADRANGLMPWAAGALLYPGCFLQKVSGGGRFGDEGESAVRLDGNQGGNRNTGLNVRSASIELLAEVHGLDTASTKSRTDRW